MHTYLSITIKTGIYTEKVMGVHFDFMLTLSKQCWKGITFNRKLFNLIKYSILISNLTGSVVSWFADAIESLKTCFQIWDDLKILLGKACYS